MVKLHCKAIFKYYAPQFHIICYLCAMKEYKVVIIGSGNVAEAFATALSKSANRVVQVYARNRERGEKLAAIAACSWCCDPSQIEIADIYLLCVSDRAIVEVASALTLPADAIIAHTAGCGTLEMLPKTARRAIIYPFQTFSAGRSVDFSKIFLFIEAEDEATHNEATDFAKSITQNVRTADASLREKIHLTGVLTSNFVNNMYATAAEVITEAGLDFDVIAPIIAETAAKAIDSRNPSNVQTGPAVRGDIQTLERHRRLIGSNSLLRKMYDIISENIWRIKETSKR